ncbi:MAG TPA: ABC transporter substrate-binding protein [Candidatus Binatia bacterium]|jgi:ABC-type nitrate/sulfonate/bicarbonate transport system substrate-binding protein
MRTYLLTILFFFLLGPLALRLAPVEAGEAGLPTVRFVQSGRTASSWPLFVGEEKKLFQKNGIYLEEIIIRGGTNVTRAVLSNTIPIGRINPDYVIDAMEKGAHVKIASGALEKLPYDLVGRPEIKNGAALKGKTIAADSLTGGTTLMLWEVTEKAFGLKQNDYKILVVGTSPDRYAALKGGSVQATFMGPPFNLRAEKEGFTKLTTFHEHLGPIQFVVQFVHEDYLKSNRAEVVKFLKGMAEATKWLYDPKNKEEALAIYTKILKSPREAAEADYRYMIEEFKPFPVDGAINKQAIEKTFDLREKAGKYEGKKAPSYLQYVDTSLVDDAKKQLGWK